MSRPFYGRYMTQESWQKKIKIIYVIILSIHTFSSRHHVKYWHTSRFPLSLTNSFQQSVCFNIVKGRHVFALLRIYVVVIPPWTPPSVITLSTSQRLSWKQSTRIPLLNNYVAQAIIAMSYDLSTSQVRLYWWLPNRIVLNPWRA